MHSVCSPHSVVQFLNCRVPSAALGLMLFITMRVLSNATGLTSYVTLPVMLTACGFYHMILPQLWMRPFLVNNLESLKNFRCSLVRLKLVCE